MHVFLSMDKKYVVTVTALGETGLIRMLAVEQKSGKIYMDAVVDHSLETDLRKLFNTKFGNHVVFVDRGPTNPPVFSEFPTN